MFVAPYSAQNPQMKICISPRTPIKTTPSPPHHTHSTSDGYSYTSPYLPITTTGMDMPQGDLFIYMILG